MKRCITQFVVTGQVRAFSLVELVVSLSIAAVLLGTLASATFMAARILPDEDDPLTNTVRAGNCLSLLTGELGVATQITEWTTTAVAFTVADRDNDGNPERIRYAWSGTAGDPVTRRYNSDVPLPIVDNVTRFAITYDEQTITEYCGGAGVEDQTDSLLLEQGSGSSGLGFPVSGLVWIGGYLKPNIPASALAWRPTRLQIRAKQGTGSGTTLVQLRTVNEFLKPTAMVLEEHTLSNADLDVNYTWQEFAFTTIDLQPRDGALAAVVQYSSGSQSSTVMYSNVPSGCLWTISGGVFGWFYEPGFALRCRLYGKLTQPVGMQYWHHRYLRAVRVDIGIGDDAQRRTVTRIRTIHVPPLRRDYWQHDFHVDPTIVDGNGDGLSDWEMTLGNFDPAELSNGEWQPGLTRVLRNTPASIINTPTCVRVRMKDTLDNGPANAAHVSIACDRGGGTIAILHARLTTDGTTQTLTINEQITPVAEQTLFTATDLGTDFVDVQLIIDPTNDAITVFANSVLQGAATYTPMSDVGVLRNDVRLSGPGGDAVFDRVEIEVSEPHL